MSHARSCVARSRIGLHWIVGLCLLAGPVAPVPFLVPDCRSENSSAQVKVPGLVPDEAILEEGLFTLINQDRTRQGLKPLTMDVSLAGLAREQSRSMAAHGYISHQMPSSGDLEARLNKAGYNRRVARENLARASTIVQAESALLESPGHARNLFATDVTHIGIGVSRRHFGSCDELYVTQIFAQPLEYAPPAAVHDSFLSQVADVRREKGIRPLRLDPLFSEMARRSLGLISLPFDRDAVRRMLTDAVSDLRPEEIQSLSRVTVDVQFVRDAKDVRIPDGLRQDRAQVLGVGVRETRDRQQRPVVVMLSFIGSTD